MNEADYKRKLVAEVNVLFGGRARRVEDRWAVGALDLIIKLPKLPVIMAEGKIIHGNLFGPTAAQFEDGNRWLEAGVPALLLGWKSGQLYISPWIKQATIKDSFTILGSKSVTVLLEYLTLYQRNI